MLSGLELQASWHEVGFREINASGLVYSADDELSIPSTWRTELAEMVEDLKYNFL